MVYVIYETELKSQNCAILLSRTVMHWVGLFAVGWAFETRGYSYQ